MGFIPHPHHAIGVLGGTFDPIHYGHLRMAEELADALGLSEVRFIPAGQPPHRNAPRSAATHRLEMVRLATSGNPRFTVDAREIELERVSYTVDTLTDLRCEMGTEQPLWLLMGADAFLGLPSWKNWRQLFDLTNIAVAHRPGALIRPDTLSTELRQEFDNRLISDEGRVKEEKGNPEATHPAPSTLPPTPAGRILLKPITQLDIAATDIRARLQQGHSVRYLTPDCIADYIEQHNLYLTA